MAEERVEAKNERVEVLMKKLLEKPEMINIELRGKNLFLISAKEDEITTVPIPEYYYAIIPTKQGQQITLRRAFLDLLARIYGLNKEIVEVKIERDLVLAKVKVFDEQRYIEEVGIAERKFKDEPTENVIKRAVSSAIKRGIASFLGIPINFKI